MQLAGISVASFVGFGVQELLFKIVPDMCSPTQKAGLVCPNTRVFFNAGMLWLVFDVGLPPRSRADTHTLLRPLVNRGLIGPQRFYGVGAQYHYALYALLIGAIIPIPFWWWSRKRPTSILRYFSAPVLINGSLNIPPASGINYASFLVVGFIFRELVRMALGIATDHVSLEEYVLRNRAFAWWSKVRSD